MNIKNFFNEAKIEFKHINWPTKQEGVKLTLIVIVISLIITLFLAFFDNIFIFLFQKFILKA